MEKHPLYNYCKKHGLFRGSYKETIACDTIIDLARFVLPKAENTLVIGTQTPACVYNVVKSRNLPTVIVDDNKNVVVELNRHTNNIYMVLGNAVNPKKAEAKRILWKNDQSTKDIPIIMDKVDSESFHRYTAHLAAKGGVCRVVHLTSGAWVGSEYTQKKYGMNFDFRTPSLSLTKVFPNLHILAMRHTGKKCGFGITYVKNGKEELYKMTRGKDGSPQLTLIKKG